MKDDKKVIAFQGKVYPVNNELHDAYYKGQRKEQYFTIDLKVERIIVDNEKESITFIPSREDSLDRLIDENQEQFSADIESIEDAAIQGVLKDRLHKSISLLSADEQTLINALYFDGHTERSWSALTGLPQKTINNRKRKILAKLKNLMGI